MKDLQERLAGLGPEQRAAFLRGLRERGVDLERLPIPRRPPDAGPAAMSPAQERLWLLHRLDGPSAVYNEPYHARYRGRLDLPALAGAVRAVARRQAVLRSTLALAPSGRPVQRVDREARIALPVVDLSGLPAAPRERAREGVFAAEAGRPFDLERGPLARFGVVRLGPEEHELLADLHHTICDARSMVILARELSAAYEALAVGRTPDLPELPVGYADYSQWQREWKLPQVLERDLPWWLERLAGAPTVLTLPADRPRPPVQGSAGERVVVRLPAGLEPALAELGRREGLTLFMTGLAAFGVLIGRYAGSSDVLVGSPVENRARPELADLIGFFVNTLPLRLDVGGARPVRELLAAVRRTVGEAFDHQDVPFATLVEKLSPDRSPAHAPLVQVLFVNQRPAARVAEEGAPAFALRRIDTGTSKFDLTLVLRERGDRLDCEIEYRTELFDRTTVLRFARHYRALLAEMAAAPHHPVSALGLLGRSELQALREWNDTRSRRPAGETVLDRFDRRVAEAPDAVALVCGPLALSYRELDRRSRRLAGRLRAAGVGEGTPVGMTLPASAGAIVAILGIQRAGGAYLPIDPAYPEERVRHLVEAADLRFAVTGGGAAPALPADGASVLGLGPSGDLVDDVGDRDERDAPRPDPAGLAYVIFTSGSTGRPKGVMVHHDGLLGLSDAFVRMFRLGPDERALLFLSLSFDASVGDVFPTLASGATLEIPEGGGVRGGAELQRLCEERRVTSIELAAAFWQQWLEDLEARSGGRVPPALRTVVTGGDSVTREAARRWLERASPGSRLLHNYGPTEASVCSASEALMRGDDARGTDRLTLGRPLPDVSIQVVDTSLRPQPAGVPGELLIGGRGVARGYLGRPAATARVFVPDPSSEVPGARLYRTGDLARWLPAGHLEFLGRIDRQVKVRGFRIEPGEVEAVLAEHPEVTAAAVEARRDEQGGGTLVAYVAGPEGGPAPLVREIRGFLASRLPEHMVPARIVVLDAMPLNVHGKIDRERLPEPGSDEAAPGGGAEPVPPSGELERVVAGIWCQVLGRERVGVHQNFFDLGGHSLLLLRVQTRLTEALGRDVPAAALFRFPTVASLAEHLGDGGAAREPRRRERDRQAPGSVPRPGPIAIVGMVGRFPGAGSVEELWRNLLDGVEGLCDLSDDDLARAGVPEEVAADPAFVRRRGVLDGYDRFDAAFFGIAPREAELLDPQHRVFLESAWEALETAGYDPARYPGSIGVFAGVGRQSYLIQNLLANPDLIRSAGVAQTVFGNEKDFFPTRVAYKLDLRGPAVTVQTACSTSLVAVHLACRSLQAGDCDLALAGGVSIAVPHRAGYPYDKGGIFSPDGRCRAYSRDAAGTVPSAGVAIVVLAPLERALAEGATVHAVIRGSAINNDGVDKVGYTAPGVAGQEAVIRRALAEAGVRPRDLGFVEGHGTGTALGDLVEVSALGAVFGTEERDGARCLLGSLKTNLGHMDCAAGAAGLIKAALAVERGEVPPTLHAEETDPRLGLDTGPFRVNTGPEPWPSGDGPRRAGVSSFGIGGTNAHVVIEEPPPRPRRETVPREWHLLTLSARSPEALDRAAVALADRLETAGRDELPLGDVAHTLRVGRRAFAHRRAVVCADRAAAVAALRGDTPDAVRDAHRERETPRRVHFVFPGIGTQHPGMGEGLYRQEPVFRAVIDRAAETLEDHCRSYPGSGGEPDLRRMLHPRDEDRAAAEALLRRPAILMPAIVATECALAELWCSRGVQPAAAVGHSLGEYAAAWLAGVFTLEDLLLLVARRGELVESLPAGAMLGVPLPPEEVEARLMDGLTLAVVNHPAMCTVSGTAEAVAALRARLAAEGVDTRRVHVDAAAHSPLLDPVLPAFRAAVAGTARSEPTLPFVSTRTGDWITPEQARDPEHWVRQLRDVVRFSDALATLSGDGADDAIFLEVGPGDGLSTLLRRQTWWRPERRAVASMARARDERSDTRTFAEACGALWLAGVEVAAAGPGETPRRVPLPTYPFERRRFWIEPGAWTEGATAEREAPRPPPAAARAVDRPYVAPRTGDERMLAALWEEMLGVAPVGVHDDYYELGGHSLLALRVLSRARDAFGVDLPTEALFEAPTVEGLARRIAAERGGARPAAGGDGAEGADGAPLPLSGVQRDVLRHLDDPDGPPQHNASAAYRGRGRLDLPALARAVGKVAERHEILRTTYPRVDGERRQRIGPPRPAVVPVVDLRGVPEPARGAEVERISKAEYDRRFELERDPLWSIVLLRLAADDHVLVRTFHRLTTDGVSIGLWTVETIGLYDAYERGEEPDPPPVELQYRHFTRRQLDALGTPAAARSLEYWRRRFDPPPPALDLPTDRPRPSRVGFVGDRLPLAVPPEAVTALREIGRSEGATLFLVALAAVEAVLGRIAGADDFAVAMPVTYRDAVTHTVMGRFINTVAHRADLSGDPPFRALVRRTRESALADLSHKDLSFDRLIDELALPADPARKPIAQVAYLLDEQPYRDLRLGAVRMEGVPVRRKAADFDLTFGFSGRPDGGLAGFLEYRTDLFEEATAERFARRAERFLVAASRDPEARLSILDSPTPAAAAAARSTTTEAGDDRHV